MWYKFQWCSFCLQKNTQLRQCEFGFEIHSLNNVKCWTTHMAINSTRANKTTEKVASNGFANEIQSQKCETQQKSMNNHRRTEKRQEKKSDKVRKRPHTKSSSQVILLKSDFVFNFYITSYRSIDIASAVVYEAARYITYFNKQQLNNNNNNMRITLFKLNFHRSVTWLPIHAIR